MKSRRTTVMCALGICGALGGAACSTSSHGGGSESVGTTKQAVVAAVDACTSQLGPTTYYQPEGAGGVVNLANAEMQVPLDIPLGFTATANGNFPPPSTNGAAGQGLGLQWEFDSRASVADGVVSVDFGDGRTVTYTNGVSSIPFDKSTITQGTTLVITQPDGTKYVFAPAQATATCGSGC